MDTPLLHGPLGGIITLGHDCRQTVRLVADVCRALTHPRDWRRRRDLRRSPLSATSRIAPAGARAIMSPQCPLSAVPTGR